MLRGFPQRGTSYTGPAGEGREFAPGFNPANYVITSGAFPTANIFIEDGLRSPVTRELTLAAGREIGNRGYAKLIYTRRRARDFVEDFTTLDNGTTTIVRNGVNFGTFDNVVFRNSDEPRRQYQALQLQSSYRLRSHWQVSGHWTVQLENDGTFEGEGPSTPAISSPIGNYPEITVLGRSNPDGHLNDFQRHKVRVWSVYTQKLGHFGAVDIAPLYRYNSALSYSLAANGVPLSAVQLSRNPGYARLPGGGSQTLFFGERGSGRFEGYHLVDLAATYTVPVWSAVKPWLKVEVLNVFNNQKVIGWDTTVRPDNAGPKDGNGLPLDYLRGPRFGQPTRNADYPRPRPGLDGGRTFLMAFGVRF